MLIKEADDRQGDLVALAALLDRSDLRPPVRRQIEQEVRSIRAGLAGEREAAYQIEFAFGTAKDVFIIHDLRVEFEGRVAQIDHLIVGRPNFVWLCESKHFRDGVAINDHGEWSRIVGRSTQGMESPIEQNERHIDVLAAVCTKRIRRPKVVGLSTRPDLRGLVLISSNAQIRRPAARAHVKGIETVVKADQLRSEIERQIKAADYGWVAKLISLEALEDFARQLAALHAPAAFDWPARFGVGPMPVPTATGEKVQVGDDGAIARIEQPVCANCGVALESRVVRYCEANAGRFDGQLYCRRCQTRVAPPDHPSLSSPTTPPSTGIGASTDAREGSTHGSTGLCAGDVCPACGVGTLVLRKGWSAFLGCSRYPACRFGTRPPA